MVQRLVQITLLAVLLAGCAVRPPDSGSDEPQAPMTAAQELDSSPALALLERSDQARSEGRNAAAERYLERALTMAPSSSWLYQSLADLRLSEGDARAAEGLALRALRLSPKHPGYRADLWQMVATARDRQGNSEGARQARDKARTLRDAKEHAA